MNMREKNYINK